MLTGDRARCCYATFVLSIRAKNSRLFNEFVYLLTILFLLLKVFKTFKTRHDREDMLKKLLNQAGKICNNAYNYLRPQ